MLRESTVNRLVRVNVKLSQASEIEFASLMLADQQSIVLLANIRMFHEDELCAVLDDLIIWKTKI